MFITYCVPSALLCTGRAQNGIRQNLKAYIGFGSIDGQGSCQLAWGMLEAYRSPQRSICLEEYMEGGRVVPVSPVKISFHHPLFLPAAS